MGRQPFNKVVRTETPSWAIGAGVVNDRPNCVMLIGKCVLLWSYVEHQLALLLGILLKADSDAAVAVFSVLRLGSTQRDAISAAAEAELDDRDFELLTAVLAVEKSIEKQRNDLAHGHFGISGEIKDGVVWVSSREHSKWNARMLNTEGKWKGDEHAKLTEKMFVYREKDLQDLYDEINAVWKILFDLIYYIRWKEGRPKTRDEVYQQLCAEPRIQRELAILRTPKTSPQAQPEPK